MIRNTTQAYGSVAKFFHWAIFLLLAVMIPVGFIMGDIENQAWQALAYSLHKQMGLIILGLMVLRVAWTCTNVKPALPFMTPAWQRLSERVVHFGLYLSLFALPISGWVGSVAAGYTPILAGYSFSLPINKSENLAETAFDYVHIPFVYILLALVTLHILAALYHHFIKRDDVLRRMLSQTRQR